MIPILDATLARARKKISTASEKHDGTQFRQYGPRKSEWEKKHLCDHPQSS